MSVKQVKQLIRHALYLAVALSFITVAALAVIFGLCPEIYYLSTAASTRSVKPSVTAGGRESVRNSLPHTVAGSGLPAEIMREYGYINFVEIWEDFEIDEKGTARAVRRVYPSVPVPKHLYGITGLDESAGYESRMSAADALAADLDEQECTALLTFLHKRPENDNLSPIMLNAVKNQTVLALMRRQPFPHELPLRLVAMYYRESTDPVWRDYCIQFLGQMYRDIGTAGARAAARATLFTAVERRDNIAGAAIIALDGIIGEPGVSGAKVAEFAYNLAVNSKTPSAVRVPALQIAAKHHHRMAADIAREILAEPVFTSSHDSRRRMTPVILKMSAMAALGSHGTKEDMALLARYRESYDIRLRAAARAAINKLQG